MDMDIQEFKRLCQYAWKQPYTPLTIDMSKNKYEGRYRIGLSTVFIPDSSPL